MRRQTPAAVRFATPLARVLSAAWILIASLGASRAEASAWSELPALCESAAARASAASGVPLSVLRAIALTETGRTRNGTFRPWPWTVNMEGKGAWFDSFEEARDYVMAQHARGARSYDVGCFQINYRWHGQHFASIEEMFNPDANAAYAARFLSELYAEFGDWSRAAGAYHSRTPYYAGKYRERFDRIRQRLLGSDGEQPPAAVAAAQPPLPTVPGAAAPPAAPPAETPAVAIRDNRFPLLRATGADRGLASLVPLEIAAGSRLIDPSAAAMP